MTLCPGKKQINALSGTWNRDLRVDLDDIRRWGASQLVSLITQSEMVELGLSDLEKESKNRGITWYHLPLSDRGVIEEDTEQIWRNISAELMKALRRGENILFHCKGGLGRTGMLTSRLLVENGMEPYYSIGIVRAARKGAIDTGSQEKAVHKSANSEGDFSKGVATIGTWARNRSPDLLDKFRGCMLGGAVGDALGASIEFNSIAEIRSRFGDEGLSDFVEVYGRKGAITDDTQMTMFTAEGCIRSYVRWLNRSLSSPADVIRGAYYRWLTTQGGTPAIDYQDFFNQYVKNGWLINVDDLHNIRAPGITCITSLEQGYPVEESKGCGGVMRVAPAGLFPATDKFYGSAFELACDAARVTHGHPSGYISAGALAEIVLAISRGSEIRSAVDQTIVFLDSVAGADEVRAALMEAMLLSDRSKIRPSPETVANLGQGWIAEEALAIGVYCALVADNFEHGVALAVNHSGDSDSTGSIAGQILGASLGIQAIPERWLKDLELRHEIEMLASDMHSISYSDDGSDMPDQFEQRYPGV